MRRWYSLATASLALVAPALAAPAAAQLDITQRPFSEQVLRDHGQPVVPIYEGWYETEDGSKRICFGYLNPNTKESLDIPLGPDNFLEPAKWDGVQPSHFRPVPERGYRRDYCVFTLDVGKDFGTEERIVWTLQSRAGPLSAPGHVLPAYELDNLSSSGRGDTAPEIRLAQNGPVAVGKTGATMPELSARVGVPLELTAWIGHPNPRSYVLWALHRGPGTVTFSEPQGRADEAEGRAATTATFSAPGAYLLRVQSINNIGTFDFYCCWTNAYVPVNVVP